MIKKIKNKKGGTMILITVMILTAITTVTLVAGEIITNGLIIGRNQVYSTIAYYAAEAGAERILYSMRYGAPGFDISSCANNDCVDFTVPPEICSNDCVSSDVEVELDNHAKYKIEYTKVIPSDVLNCQGVYSGLKRVVQLFFN
jgi:hypothetical protein